jgi:hypothetical protein
MAKKQSLKISTLENQSCLKNESSSDVNIDFSIEIFRKKRKAYFSFVEIENFSSIRFNSLCDSDNIYLHTKLFLFSILVIIRVSHQIGKTLYFTFPPIQFFTIISGH